MSAINPEILASIGDPSEVGKRLQDFSEQAARFDKYHTILTKEYPGQWAAKYAGGIFIAPTIDDLMTKLEASGINSAETTIFHLSTHPIDLIV